MGYNSNNWATEATLRNERRIKAESMSALLDHVDWNPDTLTISLSGITLSWDDIEGADNVVKKDTEGIAYMTAITQNTIQTGYLTANHLTIQGGAIKIRSGADENYMELHDTTDDHTIYMSPSYLSLSSSDSGDTEISGGYISVGTGTSATVKIEAGGIRIGNSYVATQSDLSSYMLKASANHSSAPSFFRPVGFTNSSHTSVGYMTKSEMQSWLGIEST